MAKDSGVKTSNAADINLLDLLLKGGAKELRLERAMYAAEAVGQVPVAGYLVDLIDMPAIDQGAGREKREWQAFVIETTYATKGVDREDNVVDVLPGDEIVVPATFQIATALARFARDPLVMHEIGIEPKKKIDLGGGRTMWTYRVVQTDKTKERGSLYALSEGKKVPQLGTGAPVPNGFDSKTGAELPAAAGGAS